MEPPTAEIGYWLSERHWGRGIATEVVQAATAHAFEQLDLERLVAEVYTPNAASARVLAKCGYRREGPPQRAKMRDGEPVEALPYALSREGWLGS